MDFNLLIKSIKLSAITGGLKVLCQILLALLVFPKIILDGGIAAVGSWVMLQLTIGYGGLVNLGMGSVLVKWNSKFAPSDHMSKVNAINSTTREFFGASLTSGFFFFSFVTLVLILFETELLRLIQKGIISQIPISTLWIMLIAVILRFYSSLYGALITSAHKNELVNLSQSIQLLIFIFVYFLLPEDLNVLYRLALSYTVGYIAEFVLTIIFVYRIDGQFIKIAPSISITRFRIFYCRVYPFFIMDLALIGREPLVKYAAFLLGGSTYVGVFELATKVPFAIRQAFVVGLSALMPAFVALTEKGDKDAIVKLGSLSLLYVLIGAIGSLIIYGLNSEYLLSIWLGVKVESVLLETTLILTIWWAISSLNVPAWWLGVGRNKTWFNTTIAGVHFLISLALLLMVVFKVEMSFKELVVYWVLGGIVMQIFLYWITESRTGLVKDIYLSGQPVSVFLYFLVCIAILKLILSVQTEFEITSLVSLSISTTLVFVPPFLYFLHAKLFS